MPKKLLLASLLTAALLGCNGGSENTSSASSPEWLPDHAPEQLSHEQRVNLIQRTTAGYSATQLAEVEKYGYVEWLNRQFNLPMVNHHDTLKATMRKIANVTPQTGCNFVRYDMNAAREGIWWQQMLTGEDQLRQRATYALSQLLVVSKKYNYINRHPQSLAAYYDILQKHAFGNYRDLLEEVTLSPAMGAYLSMANSKKHNPKRGTYPDENYAREVMQLFTIGLYQLNLDGSAKQDQQGNPIYTYSQKDVEAVARAFSGWTHSDRVLDENNRPMNGKGYVQPMTPGSDKWGSWHDEDAKLVLGQTLPAGQTPLKDVQDVLDILFEHPNTAPFVSKHLIQRLVTSNPSPAYIERVASVFNDNGEGVRGDLKSVLAAVWLDEEALNGSSDPLRYPMLKLKEPVIAVAEAFRILGAKSQGKLNVVLDSGEIFNAIAQGPLTANSVFNFYSPDFMPSGALLDQKLYAPEFEILPWASFIAYQNVLRSRFARVFKPDSLRCDNAVYLDLDPYFTAAASEDNNALPELINQNFLAGNMSDELRQAMVAGTLNEKSPQNKTALALSLVVTSPEFLIQR